MLKPLRARMARMTNHRPIDDINKYATLTGVVLCVLFRLMHAQRLGPKKMRVIRKGMVFILQYFFFSSFLLRFIPNDSEQEPPRYDVVTHH